MRSNPRAAIFSALTGLLLHAAPVGAGESADPGVAAQSNTAEPSPQETLLKGVRELIAALDEDIRSMEDALLLEPDDALLKQTLAELRTSREQFEMTEKTLLMRDERMK